MIKVITGGVKNFFRLFTGFTTIFHAQSPQLSSIPKHIAVIMDGNGRWAEAKNLPRQIGHRAGAKNLKNITKVCCELGVQYLTVYAFSTENWRRPPKEVQDLMDLFIEFFAEYDKELAVQDIRLRFSGDIARLKPEVQATIQKASAKSAQRRRMQLIIAFNYGGRRELVQAVNNILAKNQAITEESIQANLYLPDIPDPELVIRTGGEMRLSNFLLWQSAYAELVASPKLWPDFKPSDLKQAINEFGRRNRKFGGISQ